jgi:hypothetical protein
MPSSANNPKFNIEKMERTMNTQSNAGSVIATVIGAALALYGVALIVNTILTY